MSSSTRFPDCYLMVDLMVAMRHLVYKQDSTSCTVALYFVPIPPFARTCQCIQNRLCYLRALSLIGIEPRSLTCDDRGNSGQDEVEWSNVDVCQENGCAYHIGVDVEVIWILGAYSS